MANGSSSSFLQFIRRIAAPKQSGELPDGQLLEHFVQGRDESAFMTLFSRHGPMVWTVCHATACDVHDAEDAFQATFLVLVRKAGSIRKQTSVGSWLHGVAYRLAVKARSAAARRRSAERRVANMVTPDHVDAVIWRDLQPVLHEEVERLPRRYRAPFVLCYLEGKTNAEAADLLGWPKGTVLSSLSRARERLRARLTRRGVALTGGLLATMLSQSAAQAAVPVALSSATLNAALSFSVAGTVTAGAISANGAALAHEVLRSMFLTKLKLAAMLGAATIAGAVGVSAYPALAGKQPAANQEAHNVNASTRQRDSDIPKPSAAETGTPTVDQEKLLGTWECVFARIDDAPLDEETLGKLRLVMTKDRYITKKGDEVLFEGNHRLDPTARPKAIDIIAVDGENKGKAALGIYEIQDDVLRLCYTMFRERPTEFRSPRGSGVYLLTWKPIKS